MKIHIKNMVCNRCTMAVNELFSEAGYKVTSVKLGEVQLDEEIGMEQIKLIDYKLRKLGNLFMPHAPGNQK